MNRKQNITKQRLNLLEKQYAQLKININTKKLSHIKIDIQQLDYLCQIMNLIAVGKIKQEEFQIAQNWLDRSTKYAKYSPKMQITIQNNLACLHKKQKNFGLALVHLQKAEEKIIQFMDQHPSYNKLIFLADCSLNMCAILSSMGQHQLALQKVRKTLKYLKQFPSTQIHFYQEIYLIGKYNQAVQLQHLHLWNQSLLAYQQGKDLIKLNDPSNQLLEPIQLAIASIREKVKSFNKKKRNLSIRSVVASPKGEQLVLKYRSTKQNCNFETQKGHNCSKFLQSLNSSQKRKFKIKHKKTSNLQNIN